MQYMLYIIQDIYIYMHVMCNAYINAHTYMCAFDFF